MQVDRDASFTVTPGAPPIVVTKGEQARRGDPYWDGLYAAVLQAIRYSMLMQLT